MIFYENCDISLQDKYGDTPLHLAISNGYNVIAYLLVDGGCDIYIQNNDGITPLQMALNENNSYITNLIQSKIDGIDLPDILIDDDLLK